MTAFDFAARGLAVQARTRTDRGRTLDRLARGIARTGGRLPVLMAAADLPTLTLTLGTSAYASGATTVSPITSGASYTFLRGPWGPGGSGFPKNGYYINQAINQNASVQNVASTAPLLRFYHSAPDLEIVSLSSEAGYRLRVDGQYVATGLVANGGGNGNIYFNRVKWGDGSAAYRKNRLYELEYSSNGLFGGVRAPNPDVPWPAPVMDGLKCLVHGDSFVYGANSTAAALQPPMSAQIALLLGQPDTQGCGVGGTGFLAKGSGNAYFTFVDRVQSDVIARAPDVVIEMGGINDRDLTAATPASFDAAIRGWLAQLIAALPNVLVFMTGPMTPKGSFNTEQWTVYVRDAKKAAAALYPSNVVFIDNLAEAWVTGSGNIGAPAGDGNADWITSASPDLTHPGDAGASYLAQRVVAGIAARLPRIQP